MNVSVRHVLVLGVCFYVCHDDIHYMSIDVSSHDESDYFLNCFLKQFKRGLTKAVVISPQFFMYLQNIWMIYVYSIHK